MNKYSDKKIITLKSLTYAMKGEKLLRRSGIECRVVRPKSSKGCSYGIELPAGHLKDAEDILRRNNIEIKPI